MNMAQDSKTLIKAVSSVPSVAIMFKSMPSKIDLLTITVM